MRRGNLISLTKGEQNELVQALVKAQLDGKAEFGSFLITFKNVEEKPVVVAKPKKNMFKARKLSMPWTIAEDQQLFELREQGVPYRTISKLLKRTSSACQLRYFKVSQWRKQVKPQMPEPVVVSA